MQTNSETPGLRKAEMLIDAKILQNPTELEGMVNYAV